MVYGERRGARKQPGEYGIVDVMGLGIASAFGIGVASFIDLVQSDEESALILFNNYVGQGLQALNLSGIPMYGVVLLMMAIGGLSVLALQPVTLRGAFAQGFGVLAALTTLVSNEMPQPLGPTNSVEAGEILPLPAPEDVSDALYVPADDAMFPTPVIYAPVSSAVATAAATQSQQGYSIQMRVVFPEGLRGDVSRMVQNGALRGYLHNDSANQTYNLFYTTGAGMRMEDNIVYISTWLPGEAPMTTLIARIEAAGYRITQESFEASQGVNPTWTIRLQESGVPIWLQRLNQSYTF